MDLISSVGSASQRVWVFQVVGMIIGAVTGAVGAIGVVNLYVTKNLAVLIVLTLVGSVVGTAIFGATAGWLGRLGRGSAGA